MARNRLTTGFHMHFFRAILGAWAINPTRPRPDCPVYAVGDIHGCETGLSVLLPMIAQDSGRYPGATTVFLGDYIDRGPNSREVLEQLRSMSKHDPLALVFLKGNHEQMLIDFLDQPIDGRRWLRNGGAETLASFGLPGAGEATSQEDLLSLHSEFVARLDPQLETWIRNLPTLWQSGTLVAAHAGLDSGRSLSDQHDDALLWGAAGARSATRRDGLWVVHGHYIVEKAGERSMQIAVDTGAYKTGRLTAARILPDGSVHFLEAQCQ